MIIKIGAQRFQRSLFAQPNINKQWMNSDHPTWLMSNYKNSTIYTWMTSQNFDNICQTKKLYLLSYLHLNLAIPYYIKKKHLEPFNILKETFGLRSSWTFAKWQMEGNGTLCIWILDLAATALSICVRILHPNGQILWWRSFLNFWFLVEINDHCSFESDIENQNKSRDSNIFFLENRTN